MEEQCNHDIERALQEFNEKKERTTTVHFRWLTMSNGHIQIRAYCSIDGEEIGSPVAFSKFTRDRDHEKYESLSNQEYLKKILPERDMEKITVFREKKREKEREFRESQQYYREHYEEYLKTDHWRQRRKEILARDHEICAKCGDKAEEVHHRTYANLLCEPDEDLISLCTPHHIEIHLTKVFNEISSDIETIESRTDHMKRKQQKAVELLHRLNVELIA